MIVFPNAKINLGLQVIRKRTDGYHDIQSVFYPVPLCDVLEAVLLEESALNSSNKNLDEISQTTQELQLKSGSKLYFSSSGIPISGDTSQNLCIKACELFDARLKLPQNLAIHLHKRIPMGAGLGGGSSDGTHMLKLLQKLTGNQVNRNDLIQMAINLGSDCAFFVDNQPSIVTGRGDILTPVMFSLTGMSIVILKPKIHVATNSAFAEVHLNDNNLSFTDIISKPASEWQNLLLNDFEETVFNKYPETGNLKEQLISNGAIYASMSGSGSAVFGLFEGNPPESSKFTSDFYFASML